MRFSLGTNWRLEPLLGFVVFLILMGYVSGIAMLTHVSKQMMTILQGLKTVLRTIIYAIAILWLALWIIPMLVCHFLFLAGSGMDAMDAPPPPKWLHRVGNLMGVVASGPLELAYTLMEKDEHACR